MGKSKKNFLHICLTLLPILFLFWAYNKSPECITAMSICNFIAFMFMAIGYLGETMTSQERWYLFLFGCYYSLFAIVFFGISVYFIIKEHVNLIFAITFAIFVFTGLIANVNGLNKYRSK